MKTIRRDNVVGSLTKTVAEHGVIGPAAARWCAGMALGMVMQLPEEADETSVSKRQLLAKLDVCMGGRVAEELIFGESDVTTGASSDLEQVRPASRLP